MRPYLPLAERLGRLFASLAEGGARRRSRSPTRASSPTTTPASSRCRCCKGLFGGVSDEPVTFVNAPQLAKEHGVEVRETSSATSVDYVNLVTRARAAATSWPARSTGRRGEPRIVIVDDHTTDLPPAAHMLVVRNDDRPGMIGVVGTVLGEAGVNIADMDVGRGPSPGSALMVLATDRARRRRAVHRPRCGAEPRASCPVHVLRREESGPRSSARLLLEGDGAGRAQLGGLARPCPSSSSPGSSWRM